VDTWFVGPQSNPELEKELKNGETEDVWGIRRRTVSFGQGDSAGEYSDVVYSPFGGDITEADITGFDWPSYDLSDFSNVKTQSEEHDNFAIIVAATLGVFSGPLFCGAWTGCSWI